MKIRAIVDFEVAEENKFAAAAAIEGAAKEMVTDLGKLTTSGTVKMGFPTGSKKTAAKTAE